MSGDIPISPDGVISIHGTINAKGAIRLQGQSVTSLGDQSAGVKRHETLFKSTVNTRGMRTGARMVMRNGRIEIVAAGNIRLGGKITAKARHRRGHAEAAKSSIVVASGHDIKIDPDSLISVAAGGSISVKAQNDLTVADGTQAQACAVAVSEAGKLQTNIRCQIGYVDL